MYDIHSMNELLGKFLFFMCREVNISEIEWFFSQLNCLLNVLERARASNNQIHVSNDHCNRHVKMPFENSQVRKARHTYSLLNELLELFTLSLIYGKRCSPDRLC